MIKIIDAKIAEIEAKNKAENDLEDIIEFTLSEGEDLP